MDIHIGEVPHQVVTVLVWVAAAAGFWRGGRDGAIVALVVLSQWAVAGRAMLARGR